MSQNPLQEFEHTDSDGRDPSYFFYATGQSLAGPSNVDPPQNSAAASDRWASLVEVCASTRPSSLNASSSSYQIPAAQHPIPDLNNPFRFAPSLSSMVQAPPSAYIEDEAAGLGLSPLDNDASTTLHRPRRRHACKMCDKAFDRPSTLKTVGIAPSFPCPRIDSLHSPSIYSYTLA
jgi:hypothetical protein